MNPLDEREVRLVRRAAMAGGGAFFALYATTGFSAVGYVVAAALGGLMALLLALAARSRRRLLTGLAALMVGFGPWGGAWVLGAPFLALAGWLLFRATPRARGAAGRPGAIDADSIDSRSTGAGSTDSGSTGEHAAAANGAARPTRRGRRRRPAAPTEPEARPKPAANRRYTPPSTR